MSEYCLEFHFAGSEIVELVETRFCSRSRELMKICVRGKTSGAYQGAGTFQWSSAVRGLALLALRYVLAACNESRDGDSSIQGVQGSLAASLDYAITKQPAWVAEMFGVDALGVSLVRRIIKRTNSNRKRPGPVVLSFSPQTLPASSLRVFLDGKLIDGSLELQRLLTLMEKLVGAAGTHAARSPSALIAA